MNHPNKREATDLPELFEKANLSLLRCLQASANKTKSQEDHIHHEEMK